MGHRLSKITIRTGDKGTTGLATGLRVKKDSPRVVAMGAIDEMSSPEMMMSYLRFLMST